MVVKTATKKFLMVEGGLPEHMAHELANDAKTKQVLQYTYPEFCEAIIWSNNGYAWTWRDAIGRYLDANVYEGENRKKGQLFDGDVQRFRRASGIKNVGKLIYDSVAAPWEEIVASIRTPAWMITEKGPTGVTDKYISYSELAENPYIQRLFLGLNRERMMFGFPIQEIRFTYRNNRFMNWNGNPL